LGLVTKKPAITSAKEPIVKKVSVLNALIALRSIRMAKSPVKKIQWHRINHTFDSPIHAVILG
jgi:hypothetical protein